MPIDAKSVYDGVMYDTNKPEGGFISIDDYNELSDRAELDCIDFLSGDVAGIVPPEPYTTQKDRDWLSDFLVQYPTSIVNGIITKPSNYYLYENIYKINGVTNDDCDDDAEDGEVIPNIPVELLSNSKFYVRQSTWIESLKPSFEKPICKMYGNSIEFLPRDLGNVVLEYYRYPVRGSVRATIDPITNDQIVVSNVDYEWGEYAKNLLIWFIVRRVALHIREQALFVENGAIGKNVRSGN